MKLNFNDSPFFCLVGTKLEAWLFALSFWWTYTVTNILQLEHFVKGVILSVLRIKRKKKFLNLGVRETLPIVFHNSTKLSFF